MTNLFKYKENKGSKIISTIIVVMVIFSYFAPVVEVFADEILDQQTSDVIVQNENEVGETGVDTNVVIDTQNSQNTENQTQEDQSNQNISFSASLEQNTSVISGNSVADSQTIGGSVYISGFTLNNQTSGTFKSDEFWSLKLTTHNPALAANKRVQICLKDPVDINHPTTSCSFVDELSPNPLPGYTDSNGNWEGTGRFTDGEIGNWIEYLKIGTPGVDEMVITNDIPFTVVKAPVATGTANLIMNGVTSGDFNLGTSWTLNLTTNPVMANAPVEICANHNNNGFACVPTNELSGRPYYVNIPGTTNSEGWLTITGYFDASSDLGNWKEYMKIGSGENQIISNTVNFNLINPNASSTASTTNIFSLNNQTGGTYHVGDFWTLRLQTNDPNFAGKVVRICTKDPINPNHPTTSCSYVNQLNPNPLQGYTDSNGNWEGTGRFTASDVGNWIQYLTIGVPGVDATSTNDIVFNVTNVISGTSTSTPSVYITGANPIYLPVGSNFVDPGATAFDSKGNDLTSVIVKQTNLSTTTPGIYFINYSVTDTTNNLSSTSTRVVIVVNVDTNFFTLNDKISGTYNVGDTWNLKINTNNPAMAGRRIQICTRDVSTHQTTSCSYVNELTGLNLFGYTDSNGNWSATSTFTTDAVGSWIEYLKVGTAGIDEIISNDVSFTVNGTGNNNNGGGSNGGNTGGGSSGGIGGRRHEISGGGSSSGQILGATSCSYVNEYLKIGNQNNQNEVIKLQSFLNVFEKENLSLNGVFDQSTYDAVVRFQNKYKDEIITPWGQTNATGYVYILTKNKINEIYCGKEIPLTESETLELNKLKTSINSGVSDYSQIGINQVNDTYLPKSTSIGYVASDNKAASSSVENVFYEETSTTTEKIPVIGLKDNNSKTKSVINNLAASFMALPQKAFGGKSFVPTLLLVVLIAIIFVIVKMFFDFRKEDSADSENSEESVYEENSSPVVVLPGKEQKEENIPDEEIVIEDSEETEDMIGKN